MVCTLPWIQPHSENFKLYVQQRAVISESNSPPGYVCYAYRSIAFSLPDPKKDKRSTWARFTTIHSVLASSPTHSLVHCNFIYFHSFAWRIPYYLIMLHRLASLLALAAGCFCLGPASVFYDRNGLGAELAPSSAEGGGGG